MTKLTLRGELHHPATKLQEFGAWLGCLVPWILA